MSQPNVFHDHLDVCQQCRDHPWELCPTGREALKKAATEIPAALQRAVNSRTQSTGHVAGDRP